MLGSITEKYPSQHNVNNNIFQKLEFLYKNINYDTVNVLKFRTFFLFLISNKMLVFRAGICNMLVRIANREDPDQTASSEAV